MSERSHLVETLMIIGELHERRASLPKGFSSLFVYCTQRLGYCERTAYRRISAAKACRSFPMILELLRSGKIHLTAIVLLRDHLTVGNHQAILARAEGASLDQLKRMAAALSPMQVFPAERTRVIAVIDKASLFGGLDRPAETARQTGLVLPPAAPVKFRTEHQFTLGDAAEAKLTRARELLAHKFPMGDIESIFEAALDSLLDAVDPSRRKARPDAGPRPPGDETRRIPNGSDGRCARGMRGAARSFRRTASGAANAGSSNSITSSLGRSAGDPMIRTTSVCCAGRTIAGRGVTRSSRAVDFPSTDPLS